MRVTLRTTALALSTCLALLTDARVVRAYCRTTTMPAENEYECECSFEGKPLYWEDVTLEYTFNERGFPGIGEPALRQVFARSFARWSDVTCNGEPIAISVRAATQTTSASKEHLRPPRPNTNVISHLSEADFLAIDNSPFAFALTSVAFYGTTGELYDVDILFNEGQGPFAVCPVEGCGGSAVDLENVATHEIGHLFGLDHSDIAGATMACSADEDDIDKRSLEPDDISGICAIYGLDAIEERAAALTQSRTSTGCYCQAGAATGSAPKALAIGLALLALFAARRRKGWQRPPRA